MRLIFCAQESLFQVAKILEMCSEVMKGLVFVESQEWHFHVSKLSDNCSNIPQENGFVDVQGAKR